VFVIRAEPGEELLEAITRGALERGVGNAAIVSLIGAVDSACISNMPGDNAKDDILSEYARPMEASGTGEIRDGRPHIHAVLAAEGDTTVAGHLHWARVETHFVNVYVVPL
jgi:predicted DNA-binding protein with PD1-like motif